MLCGSSTSIQAAKFAFRKSALCRLLQCGLVLLCAGCAQWTKEVKPDTEISLAKPALSPDSVVIETALVRFPIEAAEDYQSIWRITDETVVDFATRKHLDKNGLRVGLIVGELPPAIDERLKSVEGQSSTDLGFESDVDHRLRTMTCRAGRRRELVVRKDIKEQFSIITTRNGEVSGASFVNATALFDLRTVPHPDGQATLQLTPEIQHGEYQKTFVTRELGVRQAFQRPNVVWHDLLIEARLQEGQILMISTTEPAKSLGGQFFSTVSVDQVQERVVLLVRLATTQLDELFGEDELPQVNALIER